MEAEAEMRMGMGPQSNQRGIETQVGRLDVEGHDACLNRTSVGLKRVTDSTPWTAVVPPQSNQRGIETGSSGRRSSSTTTASIEPAWD